MNLDDFNIGDIVVIHTRNDDGSKRYKLLQHDFPLNLTTQIVKFDLGGTRRTISITGFRTYKSKDFALSIFVETYCELRRPTEREEILYYACGPHLMDEE